MIEFNELHNRDFERSRTPLEPRSEVEGPPPPYYEGSSQTFGTFSALQGEPTQWVKEIVARRLAEMEATPDPEV